MEIELNDLELVAMFDGLRRQEIGEYSKVSYWKPNTKDKRKRGEFMGYSDTLEYDKSWDCLMPVVMKIDKLYDEEFPPHEEFIRRILAKEEPLDEHYTNVIALPLSTPIDEAFKAVVDFIKWHNTNKEIC